MAISVPAAEGRPGFGNLTFLLIMVALTLLAVVVAVIHPIAWTDEEMRFAVGAPVALGRARLLRGARDRAGSTPSSSSGSLAITPLLVALALAPRLARRRRACSGSAAGWGSGRSPRRPRPDDPSGSSSRPAPPPDGWLRPGWLLGLPVVWMARLPGRPAAGRVRHLVHPVGAHREATRSCAGWPAGPHRPDPARPDRARCTTTTTA